MEMHPRKVYGVLCLRLITFTTFRRVFFSIYLFIYFVFWVLEEGGGGEWEFGCLVWFPFNIYDDHNHIEYVILGNYYVSVNVNR